MHKKKYRYETRLSNSAVKPSSIPPGAGRLQPLMTAGFVGRRDEQVSSSLCLVMGNNMLTNAGCHIFLSTTFDLQIPTGGLCLARSRIKKIALSKSSSIVPYFDKPPIHNKCILFGPIHISRLAYENPSNPRARMSAHGPKKAKIRHFLKLWRTSSGFNVQHQRCGIASKKTPITMKSPYYFSPWS